MSLTIDLTPDLELQLHEEADQMGIEVSDLIVRALQSMYQRPGLSTSLTPDESRLMQQINQGLPENVWQEYSELVAQRRSGTLTSEEHTRLIALSNLIEEMHLQRMTNLAELARLRQIPLQTLMQQLGIKPRQV